MIKIGQIYKSNNCGKVQVMKKIKTGFFEVVFLNTGTTKVFRADKIKNGSIKDPIFKYKRIKIIKGFREQKVIKKELF